MRVGGMEPAYPNILTGNVILTYTPLIHMVAHMKTTLNIDDNVMHRLREEAARRGTTISELVEAGLRLVLDEREDTWPAIQLPRLPSWASAGALVDVSNRDALYAVMDGE
jgi:ribbon-helix-helix CopG family protein